MGLVPSSNLDFASLCSLSLGPLGIFQMKPLSALLVFTALLFADALADDMPAIPPPEHLDEISVRANPEWHLSIQADGSAQLTCGASIGAECPAKTFDFAQVYRSLTAVVRAKGSITDSFSVYYLPHGASTASTYHTTESDVVLPLFDTAKTHLEGPLKQSIEEQWQRHPPVLPHTDA